MIEERPPISNERRIRLRRIKSGSVLKLVFMSTTAIFVPMIVFFGVLALFGAETVSYAGRPITGVKGLMAALIMAPFFTLFFSLFAWVGAYFGIRVLGHFRPIVIEYVPADE